MKLKEFRAQFYDNLTGLYEKNEVDEFYYQLVQHSLQLKRHEIPLNLSYDIPKDKEFTLVNQINQLQDYTPIQYILGYTEFYGMEFLVNPNVLIPRPETEELVEWILVDHSTVSSLKILDVGTGSGCIAISLAKNLIDTDVEAIDISDGALKLAKENANRNDSRVRFFHGDVLKLKESELFTKMADYDLIVSNPPYVRISEKLKMKSNVLDYEPHLALFVDDEDPLIFYRKILEIAVDKLKTNGHIYFEINEYLSQPLKKLLNEIGGFSWEFRKDFFGKSRMLKLTKFE
ncbi:peptide chain release factor N(5)-glutamine methyltransferase [Aegicerativicinus sediminis]|uniref:peptide chain release factor N(5)-glutamine methyltransferase n=1 Tax=Aegicerativicinus sediminis TaxID=2893202 RepID=UPI001E5C5C90|nr:peptide chain release factor N(5)-glutamine methyltransferase [Aegicerativicinus sediminis]